LRGGHRPEGAWFAEVGNYLGAAYLRYDFTRGTGPEVAFLLALLSLPRAARILDVGCGPGRHAVELARRGYEVTGVDVSARFLELAAEAARRAGVGAAFFEVDARRMPFDDEFDAVLSLCQGGFGLMGGDDALVLRRMAEAARPGARVILTALNAYFAVANLPNGAELDCDSGVVHETTEIRNETGAARRAELWTGVYTPRELRLLAIGVGLVPEEVWSVGPGDYERREPDANHPELMLVARKPPSAS
jgi:SAM-dependent methyltransferase